MASEILSEPTATVLVGMADLAVSQDASVTLCSHPLGACLGVAIYDPATKTGGILHSLLPTSNIDPLRAATRPGMFLDTGMAAMLARAQASGAKRENLMVYVTGGAQIMDDSIHFNIGKRNYDAFTEILSQLNLTIYAEDVGGRANRTMQLNLATGEVRLKYSGQAKMKVLCKQ